MSSSSVLAIDAERETTKESFTMIVKTTNSSSDSESLDLKYKQLVFVDDRMNKMLLAAQFLRLLNPDPKLLKGIVQQYKNNFSALVASFQGILIVYLSVASKLTEEQSQEFITEYKRVVLEDIYPKAVERVKSYKKEFKTFSALIKLPASRLPFAVRSIINDALFEIFVFSGLSVEQEDKFEEILNFNGKRRGTVVNAFYPVLCGMMREFRSFEPTLRPTFFFLVTSVMGKLLRRFTSDEQEEKRIQQLHRSESQLEELEREHQEWAKKVERIHKRIECLKESKEIPDEFLEPCPSAICKDPDHRPMTEEEKKTAKETEKANDAKAKEKRKELHKLLNGEDADAETEDDADEDDQIPSFAGFLSYVNDLVKGKDSNDSDSKQRIRDILDRKKDQKLLRSRSGSQGNTPTKTIPDEAKDKNAKDKNANTNNASDTNGSPNTSTDE